MIIKKKKAANVFVKYLSGHTDSVWSMSIADNTLVTASADSTIRIWTPLISGSTNYVDELKEPAATCASCINEDKSEGVPSSVDFIKNDKSK